MVDEPFTKNERIAYGIMGCACIVAVAAFAFGIDLVPILTALAGLFAGMNIPSPFGGSP